MSIFQPMLAGQDFAAFARLEIPSLVRSHILKIDLDWQSPVLYRLDFRSQPLVCVESIRREITDSTLAFIDHWQLFRNGGTR